MAYVKINWTTTTARSTDNLDHMETQYEEAVAEGVSLRADPTEEFRLQVSSTHPAGAVAGQVYLNSGTGLMYFYDGSKWIGFSNLTEGKSESLTAVTAAVNLGGSMQYTGGDYIYIARGGNNKNFYRYTISTDSYANMADTPESYPGALTYTGGDHLYCLRHASTGFHRYTISTDSWAAMTSIPTTTNHPSIIWAGGDYIYAIGWPGVGGNNLFYRYSIAGNSWAAMTTTPANTHTGSSLTYAGGDYIYATQGAVGNAFYRYSIAGNSWAAMTNTPAVCGAGSSMSFIGHDYIYLTRGGTTSGFYRYSIIDNAWSTANVVLSDNIGAGGDMNYIGPTVGGFLYVLRGDNTTDFWKITIVDSAALMPQTWENWMN